MRVADTIESIPQALLLVGRRRDREWLQMLLERMNRQSPQDALMDATADAYPKLKSAQAISAKAREKLAQPDVCQAMEAIFSSRGFTMESAVDLHIKHIRGDITKEVINREGDVVEVRMPPSWAALQQYFKQTIPDQPKHVNVATLNVNRVMDEFKNDEDDDDVIDVSPRAIGQVFNTDSEEDEEVELFDDDDNEDDEESEDDEDV